MQNPNTTTNVICPRCSAPVGQPCMTAGGNVARNLHVTRTAPAEATTPAVEDTTPAAEENTLTPETVTGKENWDAAAIRHIGHLTAGGTVNVHLSGGYVLQGAEIVGTRTSYVIPQVIVFDADGDTRYYNLDQVEAFTTTATSVEIVQSSLFFESRAAIDRMMEELPHLAADWTVNWSAVSEADSVLVVARRYPKGSRIADNLAARTYSPDMFPSVESMMEVSA